MKNLHSMNITVTGTKGPTTAFQAVQNARSNMERGGTCGLGLYRLHGTSEIKLNADGERDSTLGYHKIDHEH